MIPPPHTPPTPQQPRRYICTRAPGEVTIDGDISKPVWAAAAWSEDFVDIEGAARPPPRHRTRFKMMWDDLCVYIAAEMEEPHLWATLTQRDSIVYHDNDFEVFLNPTGDNHRYYEVEVNALNTVFDLFLPKPYRDGGPADHGWDVRGMRSAVRLDGTLNDPRDVDRGWSLEMALPWSAFDRHGGGVEGGGGGPPSDGDQWRINFSRVQWDLETHSAAYHKIAGRPEHNWAWSPQGIIDMHRPEQWGYVQFNSAAQGASWREDPSEAARRLLHAVYYAQAGHRAATGAWAVDLATLGLRDQPSVEMAAGAGGWVAWVPSGRGRWCIRQDSLVWHEPG